MKKTTKAVAKAPAKKAAPKARTPKIVKDVREFFGMADRGFSTADFKKGNGLAGAVGKIIDAQASGKTLPKVSAADLKEIEGKLSKWVKLSEFKNDETPEVQAFIKTMLANVKKSRKAPAKRKPVATGRVDESIDLNKVDPATLKRAKALAKLFNVPVKQMLTSQVQP